MSEFDSYQQFSDLRKKFEASVNEMIEQKIIAAEQLTKEQFADAINQAIACGDFIRLVTPTGAQTVCYHPYDREQQLLEEVKKWREVAEKMYWQSKGGIQVSNIPTPRTDDAEWYGDNGQWVVASNISRQLERELADANRDRSIVGENAIKTYRWQAAAIEARGLYEKSLAKIKDLIAERDQWKSLAEDMAEFMNPRDITFNARTEQACYEVVERFRKLKSNAQEKFRKLREASK